MLDTRARRALAGPLDRVAALLDRPGITPDRLTLLGLVVGVAAAVAAARTAWWIALGLWLASRLLDGLDGPLARRRRAAGQPGDGDAGGFLDIASDFVVYGAFVVGVALGTGGSMVPFLFVMLAYYANGSAFLAFSSIAERRGVQIDDGRSLSFFGGLAEGTETVIVHLLWCVLPGYAAPIAWAWAAVVGLSALQRIIAGYTTLRRPRPSPAARGREGPPRSPGDSDLEPTREPTSPDRSRVEHIARRRLAHLPRCDLRDRLAHRPGGRHRAHPGQPGSHHRVGRRPADDDPARRGQLHHPLCRLQHRVPRDVQSRPRRRDAARVTCRTHSGPPKQQFLTVSAKASGAVLLVVAADWLSKTWARQPGRDSPSGAPLWGSGSCSTPGASFGFVADHPVVVAAAATGMTLILLMAVPRTTQCSQKLALAVALGGALGNLADRAFHGSVTDWVHLSWYAPSFNVADVAVRGGLTVAFVPWIRPSCGSGLHDVVNDTVTSGPE